jgi:hypothetical protein
MSNDKLWKTNTDKHFLGTISSYSLRNGANRLQNSLYELQKVLHIEQKPVFKKTTTESHIYSKVLGSNSETTHFLLGQYLRYGH